MTPIIHGLLFEGHKMSTNPIGLGPSIWLHHSQLASIRADLTKFSNAQDKQLSLFTFIEETA